MPRGGVRGCPGLSSSQAHLLPRRLEQRKDCWWKHTLTRRLQEDGPWGRHSATTEEVGQRPRQDGTQESPPFLTSTSPMGGKGAVGDTAQDRGGASLLSWDGHQAAVGDSPRPGCSRETGVERHLQVLNRWPGSGLEHLTWRDRWPLSAVPRAQAKVSVPLPTSSRATDPQTHCPRTPVA